MKTRHTHDAMEQLPESEMLACVIAAMLDEGEDACRVGDGEVVSIQDLSLMLCDLLRSERLGIPATPATKNAMNSLVVELAIYRAMNRV